MTIFSFCDDGKLWDPAKSKDFFFLFFGTKVSTSSAIEVVDDVEAAANLNFLAFTELVVEVEVVVFLEAVRLTMLENPFLTCFVKLVLLSATALVRSPNAALLRVLALLSTFSSATRFLLRGGLMGCS